jgi:hypothetical protein
MDWTNHLNNLRAKSDAEKRRIAFLYATLGTGLIFVIWLFSVAVSLGNLSQVSPAPAELAPVAAAQAPAGPSWVQQLGDFTDSVGRGAVITGNRLKTMFK